MNPPVSWRMSFPHRNKARPELDMAAETTPITEPCTQIQPSVQLAGLPNNASGSRFHILARVVVSDRSVWMPPGNTHVLDISSAMLICFSAQTVAHSLSQITRTVGLLRLTPHPTSVSCCLMFDVIKLTTFNFSLCTSQHS